MQPELIASIETASAALVAEATEDQNRDTVKFQRLADAIELVRGGAGNASIMSIKLSLAV